MSSAENLSRVLSVKTQQSNGVIWQGSTVSKYLEYSQLSLSRSPRDSLEYFEISIPQHQICGIEENNKSNNHI